MKCLVTGATGFIGSALISKWLENESVDEVIALTRSPKKITERFDQRVTPVESLSAVDAGTTIDAVINLAGEPILDKRWSAARKQQLYQSRLQTTEAVLALLSRLTTKPDVLISGSAIGYYGSQQDDRELNEKEEGLACFAHRLCRDWENKALEAEREGVRVCLIRTGVVLGHGGALAKMLPPFRLGLGGPIGHGRQWMSWIDLEDQLNAIDYLLRHQTLSGPFNLTAPLPVTNREFSKTLGKLLQRPAVLPVPALVLRLMLGEGAELLVEGQRVVPEKLLGAGFEFRYPQLQDSLVRWLR